MTASWSTGRTKKHPYYHCKNKQCDIHAKSIKREALEDAFKDILAKMKPSSEIIELAEAVIKDVWNDKKGIYNKVCVERERQLKALDADIDGFMGRLLETDSKAMIKKYEDHIQSLEDKRAQLSILNNERYNIDTSYESSLGTVMDFIKNPYSIWANGDLDEKRLVLKLAFAKRIPYDKNKGFGTASMTLPFTVLGDMGSQKSKMVEEAGFEPT